MPFRVRDVKSKYETIKNELERIPGVISAAASSDIPLNGFTSNGYIPEGLTTPLMIHVLDTDNQFLSTYNIDLLEGENFRMSGSATDEGYLVNESLVKKLGWKSAVGKEISRDGKHKIIGIIKDFHYSSLHQTIEPLIVTNKPIRNKFSYLSLKIKTENLTSLIGGINSVWENISPSTPFDYFFLDQEFNQLYKEEHKFGQLFLSFSVLGIIIAVLGLFSLSSFSLEQRTKEIGIRKALGASSAGISGLILKDYIILVIIANLLAWPAAYFFMDHQLNDFAYRIKPDIITFIISALAALIITLLTISYHFRKISRTNPIDSLRYE